MVAHWFNGITWSGSIPGVSKFGPKIWVGTISVALWNLHVYRIGNVQIRSRAVEIVLSLVLVGAWFATCYLICWVIGPI